ncbi:hypothetical protein [Sphingobium sp. Cam5-1]|uniref:hypothetical protein n=1 Tax=Sphingobium sp. Cam5-1 TaxID=2789327 RepID=UPI0018AD1571|nr:hypothetical protein [Sphingobium sp. Cam5-1]QPI71738.1 hypothetical protein IZV00_07220 [Sphingobium sp. Cam5-1]
MSDWPSFTIEDLCVSVVDCVNRTAPVVEGPILDTPDGPLPEGWTWGAFRDLAREVRQTVSPDDVPPDTPYVGLEHMPRRSFTLDQHGQAEEVSSLKSRFQRSDILFGKIRPYFHKVVWAGFDGVSSTDAIVWRPVAGLAAQALATASSDAFVAYSVQTSNGTKMPRAKGARLGMLPTTFRSRRKISSRVLLLNSARSSAVAAPI